MPCGNKYEGQHSLHLALHNKIQKSKKHTRTSKLPRQPRLLARRPDNSNSCTFSGAFLKLSSGSQVLSQGPYPLQLTRYSTRLRTNLFAVTASTSNSWSSVSGLKTGARRPGGAPSCRFKAETWWTGWMPRKSSGSCNLKLTGDTCATTEKGPHHFGANLRDKRPCNRKLVVDSQT